MRWRQTRRICYGCGTPLWGFHKPLGPHPVSGGGGGGGGGGDGECDDDRDDDDEGGH